MDQAIEVPAIRKAGTMQALVHLLAVGGTLLAPVGKGPGLALRRHGCCKCGAPEKGGRTPMMLSRIRTRTRIKMM